MKNRTRFLLSIGLLILALPVFAGPPIDTGVTRTPISGDDNWAGINPLDEGTVTCPGGELTNILGMPSCVGSTSTLSRLHFRDAVLWSCMTANDERITGVGLFTVNGNLDAESNGPVWGKWKIVPMADCEKDGPYPEEYVNNSTEFWRGTWNGTRVFDIADNVWKGYLEIIGKGFGDLDGLHFDGSELIVMYTTFPVPYEFLPPHLGLYDAQEGIFIGTIKE